MIILLMLAVIITSIVTAWITTKVVTIRYFEVIDGYVKGLFEDTKKALRKAAGVKKGV